MRRSGNATNAPRNTPFSRIGKRTPKSAAIESISAIAEPFSPGSFFTLSLSLSILDSLCKGSVWWLGFEGGIASLLIERFAMRWQRRV